MYNMKTASLAKNVFNIINVQRINEKKLKYRSFFFHKGKKTPFPQFLMIMFGVTKKTIIFFICGSKIWTK